MARCFFLFGVLFLFAQCKKEEANPFNQHVKMWECHQEIDWDSVRVAHELVGHWEWEFLYDPWSGGNDQELRGLGVSIFADQTLITFQDGINRDTTTWEIIYTGIPTFYFLKTPYPSIHELQGRIRFCEDRLLLFNSDHDGTDYFYEKVE